MKSFFTTIYQKTYLLACFITIAYHIFYLYLFDNPYLFTIKIIILFIWIIEIIGYTLDQKDPCINPKRLERKINPKIRESYNSIENMFYIFFFIYIFIPKEYIWPNYFMMVISGLFLGYRIAITTSQYSNKLKKQLNNTHNI